MSGDSKRNQNKSAGLDEGSLKELRESQWSLASDMGALFRKIRSFQTTLDKAKTALRAAQKGYASMTVEVHKRSSAFATRLEAQAGQLISMHQAIERVEVEVDLAGNEQAAALEKERQERAEMEEHLVVLDEMIKSLDEQTGARFSDHEERHRSEAAALEEAQEIHAESMQEVRDGLVGLGQRLNLQSDELLALQRWAEATAADQAQTLQDHADALKELHLAHQDQAAALRQVQLDQASALEEVLAWARELDQLRETQKLALNKVRRMQNVLNERLAAQAGLTQSVQELLEEVVAAQLWMDRSHMNALEEQGAKLEALQEEQESQGQRIMAQTHFFHLLNERVEETTIEQTRVQEVQAREAEALRLDQAVEMDELNASLKQEREAREAQWLALEELRAELDSVRQKHQAELHVREEIEAALREKLEEQADQIRELQERVESFSSGDQDSADQDSASSNSGKLQCA